MKSAKDITSMRRTLEFLREQNEVLTVEDEVDPIYEIAGIQKALDGSFALLFENIKGYPGVRNVANIFSREDRVAKIFGVSEPEKLKFKCLEAMKNPIPPRVVDKAPCQEIVITKDIDIMGMLPIIKHTERDAGRILGGGNTLLGGEYFAQGFHISFNRCHFRGKDWASLHATRGTHLGDATRIVHRGDKIPLTINITTPPAVMAVAGAAFLHPLVPPGTDELGFAGGLQGSAVELVKAKTVDAYAIAETEWVIEGYIDTTQIAWESDEAEEKRQPGVAPFFPEWPGYLGRSYKMMKFQATAITHRRDKPLFFTPLARSFEGDIIGSPFREACFYELAERLFPGLVVDVNILKGVAGWGGNMVFQVKKRRSTDDGHVRSILNSALSIGQFLRFATVVDEDVDIYSTDDVLWAIITRAEPSLDIITGFGGMGQTFIPAVQTGQQIAPLVPLAGGVGIDATAPFDEKWRFERAKYPVHLINLKKWFSEDVISRTRALQSDYARVLARTGG